MQKVVEAHEDESGLEEHQEAENGVKENDTILLISGIIELDPLGIKFCVCGEINSLPNISRIISLSSQVGYIRNNHE